MVVEKPANIMRRNYEKEVIIMTEVKRIDVNNCITIMIASENCR